MHPIMPVDRRVLAQVRKICLDWPAANGDQGPTHDRPSISIKVTPLLRAKLTERPGFGLTPYSAHQGGVTVYTDRKFDWDEVADYLRLGYRLVAQKRLLAEMDAAESQPTRRSTR